MEPPPYNLNIRIAGIEVTQGIQFFNLTGQGIPGVTRNIMYLVDNKTTVLRVYPDCLDVGDPGYDPNFSSPSDITARLRVRSPSGIGVPTRAINSPINAEPLATLNRAVANDTLSFRIPAWLCTGRWEVDVQILDREDDTSYSAPFRLVFSFSRWSTNTTPPQIITDYRLRVFVVRIIYTGPDANGNPTLLGPTSERSMVLTLSNSAVSRMFPVSGINYTGSITAEFNGDLRVEGSGGCGRGWDALIDMLLKQRAASSSADVVLGLLPETSPQFPQGQVDLQVVVMMG
jgi:hypothetical protein